MSNLVNRMAYETLSTQYARAGINAILTESSLTLAQNVVANTTSYTWDLLTTEGVVKSWESRLSQSDSFHATSFKFLIGAGAAVDDPETEFYTYPAEIMGATYQDYYVAYNSTMDISVQNVRFIQSYDMNKFLDIPETQRLSAGANNNFNQIGGAINDVTQYLATSIQLSGAKKNQITMNLPGSVAVPIANTFFVLKVYGIVAIGGAIFNT